MITKEELLSTPSGPGVYLFWENKHPIYIGKAINIKARLLSHLQNSKFDRKEKRIISRTTHVSFQETISEFEALLLEAKNINKYQPIYNVSLKDDKSYLYIKITIKDIYPKVFAVRRENDHKSCYFGPFESARLTSMILRELRKIVPFCTQKKIGSRSCFYSKIDLCNPCPSIIEKTVEVERKLLQKKYRNNINRIRKILRGDSDIVVEELEKELSSAIKKQNFERGIILRNKIHLFRDILFSRSFHSYNQPQHKTRGDIASELSVFLEKNFHKEIVFNAGHQSRVECYDISNLFGKQATGSMVVFVDGVAMRDQYRRFKIHLKNKVSDPNMMKEMLERRFLEKDWARPDLIILDGGRPQLRKIISLLSAIDIKIPIVGIAKRPDRLIAGTKNLPAISKAQRSILFYMFQEIRDESHRFAKKYHLLLRKKQLMI